MDAGFAHAFVTDRFDLTAAEIVRLDRLRWRIELCFRFLKRQLGLLPLLGRSEAAVWLSVLVAAIVAILLLLLTAERPTGASRDAWAHLLGLTQKELAGRLRVSRQTVISIELGRFDPSLPLAFRIADELDASIHDIFDPKE